MISIRHNGSIDGDNSMNPGGGITDQQAELNAEHTGVDATAHNTNDEEFLKAGTRFYEEITTLLDDQSDNSDQHFQPGNEIRQKIRQVLQRRIELPVDLALEGSFESRVDKVAIQLKSLFPRVRKRESALKTKYGRQKSSSWIAGSNRSHRILSTSGGSTSNRETIRTASVPGRPFEGDDAASNLVRSMGVTSLNG